MSSYSALFIYTKYLQTQYSFFNYYNSKNTLKHLKVTLGTQLLSAIPLSNVLGCPCQNLGVRENVENECGVRQEKQADQE